MIHRVFSDLPGFKEVSFRSGFNVILADRTQESTKKDSRNGLGKSTLISIIHFVLGARLSADNPLSHPELNDIKFGLEISIFGRRIKATRSTRNSNYVEVAGDVAGLPLDRDQDGRIALAAWHAFLGLGWFGLPAESSRKYRPTFRSSISYVARSGKDAYSEPFRTHRVQAAWDIQVHNAFLLGLSWEDASDWQELKDRKKLLDDLRSAAQSGVIEDVFGSRGQLEADRVRLKELVARTSADLKNFKVHSSYSSVEQEANRVTRDIRELSNANAVDERLLELYKTSMAEEGKVSAAGVNTLYEDARVLFPAAIKQQLADVEAFHSQVVEYRRQFLLQETDRLGRLIEKRKEEIAALGNIHAELLQTLNTHGALEQYTKLQEAHANDLADLRDIEARLRNIKDFEEGRNNLKIEMAMLEKRARVNYETKLSEREAAVAIFNENSQALYSVPGRLMIEITDSGFSFGVEIERKGSTGISNMEIFCYDLMIAERWSKNDIRPGFLLHDSNVFADVDDRQIALAIELAELKSRVFGFQYICTFNSDKLPLSEFSPGFSIDDFTNLRLTDQDQSGGLLGRRLSAFVKAPAKRLTRKTAAASP